MAPPEAEWMLWAKRLRDENKLLLQRIDAKPESSAIDLLAEEVRTLATTIQHLQQDNHALRDRIHELERDALDQKQVAGDEFRGLERAMADMKNELSRTTELVQTLREEEGLYQTQMQKKTTPRAVARITYRTRAGEIFISFSFHIPKGTILNSSIRVRTTHVVLTDHLYRSSFKSLLPSHDYR